MRRVFQFATVLFLGIIISQSVNAQNYYFHINTGYNHAFSTQNIYNDDLNIWFTNSDNEEDSHTNETIFLSLGQGVNFGSAFGIMFSEYIGLELEFSYLLGMKAKAENITLDGNSKESIYSRMFRIIPAVIVTPGLENVNPYAKFGLVFGIGSVFYEIDGIGSGFNYFKKTKLNGGIAVGLNSAIGVRFNFTNSIGMFVELNLVNMSYAPKKGEVVKAIFDDKDVLPDMTIRQKEIEFVDKLTSYYGVNPPMSQPQQMLKYKLPFSSIGAHVGLVILIGN
jgi:hypothetical protein